MTLYYILRAFSFSNTTVMRYYEWMLIIILLFTYCKRTEFLYKNLFLLFTVISCRKQTDLEFYD